MEEIYNMLVDARTNVNAAYEKHRWEMIQNPDVPEEALKLLGKEYRQVVDALDARIVVLRERLGK